MSIASHFASLPDPRVERTRHHALLEIITIAILAVICGADSWDQIEEFARGRLPWLRTFLRLEKGAPSDDTFRRVFSALDPKLFAQCFAAWLGLKSIVAVERERIVDGRVTYERAEFL